MQYVGFGPINANAYYSSLSFNKLFLAQLMSIYIEMWNAFREFIMAQYMLAVTCFNSVKE